MQFKNAATAAVLLPALASASAVAYEDHVELRIVERAAAPQITPPAFGDPLHIITTVNVDSLSVPPFVSGIISAGTSIASAAVSGATSLASGFRSDGTSIASSFESKGTSIASAAVSGATSVASSFESQGTSIASAAKSSATSIASSDASKASSIATSVASKATSAASPTATHNAAADSFGSVSVFGIALAAGLSALGLM